MPSLLEVVRSALSDRYRVERELGHGGMATVYLAEDLRHDRPVAIKVLDPALAAGVGGERFLREIRFAARLTHPNILPLFESGEIPARPDEPGFATLYYVMPYVQGESLRARIDREGPLPLRDTVRITASIASALEHAHAQGIVHRDVKPENILLEAGEAVLADLGIARAIGAATGERLTATRLTLGTPAYMSPEQVTADAHVDGRSDQYSLACVTYEMLTGEPPFGRGKAQAAMTRRVVEPPPRVGIIRDRCPPQVDDVLARAMARAAADRFPTPGEFARALGEAAGSETGNVRAALAGGSRRKRAGVAIVLIVATAGAAVGLVLSRSEGGSITGPASVMAVMPLVPASDDSALARLGRDLVVTVSQTLDGIGGVRAVDAQTVLLRAGSEPPGGLAGAMRMARDLGAGAVLHGSLVRIGRSVRSDVMLSAADTGAPLARVSVTALPDSIGAITDSIVRGLLRQIWKGRDAPSPSLDVAMRTRSFDALREFLAGEQMLVRGAWIEAADAYTRAIGADSTFWLAYWRAAYARGWHGEPLDPALAAALEAHADEVPPRERLMLRATALTEDSVSGGISLLRELTHRYPDHWFGWLMYGDVLTHFGAAVGESRQEAVSALDRAVTLNPNLIPAWEHLAWLTLLERDTAAAARAIEVLRRSGSVTAESFGWDEGVSLALTDRLIRGDSMGAARLMEAHVADLAGRADPSFGATALVRHAFPVEQIEVVRRVLARGPPPAAIPAYRIALVRSLAKRGAWDSALATAEATGAAPILGGAAGVYRLAVVAAWLGAVPREAAIRRRAAAARATEGDSAGRAELYWLDGVLAFAGGDSAALDAAISRLVNTSPAGGSVLRRSLAALAQGLRGEREAAARELVAVDASQAQRGYSGNAAYPVLNIVARMTAARWVAAQGRYVEAETLLEGVSGVYTVHAGTSHADMVWPLVELELARVAEAAGAPETAAAHYREFLRVYDLAPPSHRDLVSHARAAVAR